MLRQEKEKEKERNKRWEHVI